MKYFNTPVKCSYVPQELGFVTCPRLTTIKVQLTLELLASFKKMKKNLKPPWAH